MKNDWIKQLNATRKEDVPHLVNVIYDALVEVRSSVPNSINDLAASTAGLPVALLSVWSGNEYPSYGAAVTDYRGPVEPTLANNGDRPITGYDQWYRSSSAATNLSQFSTILGIAGPITMGTYSYTMPTTNIVAGNTVIIPFGLATSVVGDATHNITVSIADQANGGSRTLPPVAPAMTVSGFSSHIYSFTATAQTAGATVTITRAGTATGTGNVRCIPYLLVINGLLSSTPTIAAKGAVVSGANHASPTATTTVANTVEISFVADRDTVAPGTESWGMADLNMTTLIAYGQVGSSPYHAAGLAWNPSPVPNGTQIGGRVWTASGGGANNTDSFGGAWTLGYTANNNSITAARFGWDNATSSWKQV